MIVKEGCERMLRGSHHTDVGNSRHKANKKFEQCRDLCRDTGRLWEDRHKAILLVVESTVSFIRGGQQTSVYWTSVSQYATKRQPLTNLKPS